MKHRIILKSTFWLVFFSFSQMKWNSAPNGTIYSMRYSSCIYISISSVRRIAQINTCRKYSRRFIFSIPLVVDSRGVCEPSEKKPINGNDAKMLKIIECWTDTFSQHSNPEHRAGKLCMKYFLFEHFSTFVVIITISHRCLSILNE